jgi:hypothetical protein
MVNDRSTLTYDECMALSHLSGDETAAISKIPSRAVTGPLALAAYLVRTGDGSTRLSRSIEEDLAVAIEAHDHAEVARLKLALQHFLSSCTAISHQPAATAADHAR